MNKKTNKQVLTHEKKKGFEVTTQNQSGYISNERASKTIHYGNTQIGNEKEDRVKWTWLKISKVESEKKKLTSKEIQSN